MAGRLLRGYPRDRNSPNYSFRTHHVNLRCIQLFNSQSARVIAGTLVPPIFSHDFVSSLSFTVQVVT